MSTPAAVVVHAGARDSYQLAAAMHEEGLLYRLVTNVYSRRRISERYGIDLPKSMYRVPWQAFLAFWAMRLRFGWDLNRASDAILGEAARRAAVGGNCAVFAYSYYARQAFDPERLQLTYRFLFQLHPHPRSVRKILTDELERTPLARESLLAEHEMSGRDSDIEELASESQLANGIVAASRFTAATLVENGIRRETIHVAPYGVDRRKYPPLVGRMGGKRPFTVIWVGNLSQRKGLSYFLDSIRLLKPRGIRVLLRGHHASGRAILDAYRDLDLDVRYAEPRTSIVRDLHEADVYVLPSLAEGFGQTIPEAMSCGVPVITTPNTCGPDLIADGQEGFIVPIRDPEAIAGKLDWCIRNRGALREMGQAASEAAERLSWAAFRENVRAIYHRMVSACHENQA